LRKLLQSVQNYGIQQNCGAAGHLLELAGSS
jgi:hypothetical protein